MPKTTVFNYTDPNHIELFNALVDFRLKEAQPNELITFASCHLYRFTYQDRPIKFVLPISAFQYKRSTDHGKNIIRMALFESFTNNSGSYGKVLPVIAHWKRAETRQQMKTNKPYVAKAVALTQLQDSIKARRIAEFQKEHHIISQVPHLLAKYSLTHTKKQNLFLLMKQVEGVPLSEFINKMKNEEIKLSPTQLLRLILNMAMALENQSHGLKIITKDSMGKEITGHIIHADIKPANLMVNDDEDELPIKIVDYGLSSNSNDNKRYGAGSYVYMEPQVAIDRTERTKKTLIAEDSDRFSLGVTISVLLTSTFRNFCQEESDINALLTQNHNIILTNLFERIDGLSQDEMETIHSILMSMTRFERKDRLPYPAVVEVFRRLFVNKIKIERDEINHLTVAGIEKLSAEQLFNYLQSKFRTQFLEKLQANPLLIPGFLLTLRPLLHLLNETAIQALIDLGIRFNNYHELSELILNKKIKTEKIPLLFSLGAVVTADLLKKWLEQDNLNLEKASTLLHWVKVCRVLVSLFPESKQIISQAQFDSPFKQVFCQYLLGSNHYLPETCVRLVRNHLEFIDKRQKIIKEFDQYLTEKMLPEYILTFYKSYVDALKTTTKLLLVDTKLARAMALQKLLVVFNECEKVIQSSSFNPQTDKMVADQITSKIKKTVSVLFKSSELDINYINKQIYTLKEKIKLIEKNSIKTLTTQKKTNVSDLSIFPKKPDTGTMSDSMDDFPVSQVQLKQ